MHLHILGICGTFMGGIAALAKAAGHRVSGCDANVYPPMSTQLEALGIALTEGFDAAQLAGVAKDADVFVVGNVVSRGNPLVEAILDAGRAYVSGPQWLYENVLRERFVLAVAGTHGKTTTSAMLAWILERAGLQPGFLIGGVPVDFGVSARHSASAFFVIEADEYDTAFFDKRSKFVHYRPRTAILNNLEFDHADIFADLASIETQFHHLVRTVPASGRLIVNGGEASVARVLARGCWSEVERFGIAEVPGTGPDWTIAVDGAIQLGGAPQGVLRFGELGRHNQLNALAAIAAARHAGVPVRESLEALAAFRGVKRRLELRGAARGVSVYDDFAHHPTAIATTLDGLRRKVRDARILAVLEPRSNTMKLGTMKAALPDSLRAADRVFCYAGNLGWDAAGALAPLGDRAEVHTDLAAL
ncbi:MAG: UDP-N-acetylmuramate:L-alanyl-gamma-D-glutamyl-meso-diaminopimelate ligase, partial [Casimicrobiaceae bacterium]